MTETMLVVDTAALVGLLTDALKTVGDRSFPAINGVVLHSDTKDDRTVLVATSTNRIMVGQGHTPANGELPRMFLNIETVKQVVAVLRVSKKSSAPCEIRTKDDLVYFTQSSLPGFAGISVNVAPDKDDFVKKTAKLLTIPEDASDEKDFRLSGKWLTALVQVANRRESELTFHPSSNLKPVIVTIGENYRAVIAPVRGKESKTAPVFDIDAVTPAAEDVPAAA